MLVHQQTYHWNKLSGIYWVSHKITVSLIFFCISMYSGVVLHIHPSRWRLRHNENTVYPKKYAHGFCFVVLCCGYTLTDFPISIGLTSLALWQSNDCPSASKATLMNMDKYFMWIHYERLHDHNKAKHNKTVCIFLGIYCTLNTNQYVTMQVVTDYSFEIISCLQFHKWFG